MKVKTITKLLEREKYDKIAQLLIKNLKTPEQAELSDIVTNLELSDILTNIPIVERYRLLSAVKRQLTQLFSICSSGEEYYARSAVILLVRDMVLNFLPDGIRVDILLNWLKDINSTTRYFALALMESLFSNENREDLIPFLTDEDPVIRASICIIFIHAGGIFTPLVNDTLRAETDGRVHLTLVQEILKLKESFFIPWILNHYPFRVGNAIEAFLYQILVGVDPEDFHPAKRFKSLRSCQYEFLKEPFLGKTVRNYVIKAATRAHIPALLGRIHSGDMISKACVTKLASFPPAAFPPYYDLLKTLSGEKGGQVSPFTDEIHEIMSRVRSLDDPESIQRFLGHVQTAPKIWSRLGVLDLLGDIGDASVALQLFSLFEDAPPVVQDKILDAVTQILRGITEIPIQTLVDGGVTWDFVEKHLNHPSHPVQGVLAHLVSKFPRIMRLFLISQLTHLLPSSHPPLSENILQLLDYMEVTPDEQLCLVIQQLDQSILPRALKLFHHRSASSDMDFARVTLLEIARKYPLPEINSVVLEVIPKYATSATAEITHVVLEVFPENIHGEVARYVEEKLNSEEGGLRAGALRALYEMANDTSFNLIVASLGDVSPLVRLTAARALQEMENINAIAPLLQAYEIETDEETFTAITDALMPFLHDEELRAKLVAQAGIKLAEPLLQSLFRNTIPWSDTFIPLFGDYAPLIRDAVYGVESTRTWCKTYSKMSYSCYRGSSAIRELCNLGTPLSTNILHLLKQKRDIQVVDNFYEDGLRDLRGLSFQHQRDLAASELAARGNPPYAPRVYFDSKNWVIKDESQDTSQDAETMQNWAREFFERL